MGKIAFFTLADESSQIQLYLEKATLDKSTENKDILGNFAQLTDLVDVGDLQD